MRKTSEAQLYLEKIEFLDAIIKNKLIEQRQWKEIALGITANMDGERVQSSGSKSKMADALHKVIDMEAEIDRVVDALIDRKRETVAILEQLDSPTFYNVLHMKYVQYKSLQEVADKYKKSYDWATTTQGRALANVQRILDAKRKEGA